MTTVALKKKILTKLKSAKNKHILEDVYRLLELEDIDKEPFEISKEQLKKVKTGQNQIKQGKTKSHSQANKEVEKWLAK